MKGFIQASFLLSFVLILGGCSTTSSISFGRSGYSDTMEIIRQAAALAPQSVPRAEYRFEIKAGGTKNSFDYLNTEYDYRDPRNITIALVPVAVLQFIDKYKMMPHEYFIDKSVQVSGEAKRVQINFLRNGKPTGKYYYQTHILVTDIAQLRVVGDEGA